MINAARAPRLPIGSREDNEWGRRHRWPYREIAAVAEAQRGMIGHRQLLTLGVQPRTIAAALAVGRLHPVHRGVYSLIGSAAWPPWAAEQAAILADAPGRRS